MPPSPTRPASSAIVVAVARARQSRAHCDQSTIGRPARRAPAIVAGVTTLAMFTLVVFTLVTGAITPRASPGQRMTSFALRKSGRPAASARNHPRDARGYGRGGCGPDARRGAQDQSTVIPADPLLRLMGMARSEAVRQWACDALQHDFKLAMREVSVLTLQQLAHIAVISAARDELLLWLLKNTPHYEQQQFVALGLHGVVVGLLSSPYADAQRYACAYAKAHARDLPLDQLLRLSENPTAEVRQLALHVLMARDPRVPEKMTGGINNPLGALSVGDVVVRHGAVPALRGVTVAADRGEIVAVMGRRCSPEFSPLGLPGWHPSTRHSSCDLSGPSWPLVCLNPFVSIGPILRIPGIADAVRATSAPVVGVSPIIGGAPVRGMADACLTAIGVAAAPAVASISPARSGSPERAFLALAPPSAGGNSRGRSRRTVRSVPSGRVTSSPSMSPRSDTKAAVDGTTPSMVVHSLSSASARASSIGR